MIDGYQKVRGDQISKGDELISRYRVVDVAYEAMSPRSRRVRWYVLTLEPTPEFAGEDRRTITHRIKPDETAWVRGTGTTR